MKFKRFSVLMMAVAVMVAPSMSKNVSAETMDSANVKRDGYHSTKWDQKQIDSVFESIHNGDGTIEEDEIFDESFPVKFDPTDPDYRDGIEPYLPAVRNQMETGTCWAHSSLGMAEISLNKQGKNKYKNASGEDVEYNASETELAYYTYHTYLDPLEGIQGDVNCAKYDSTQPTRMDEEEAKSEKRNIYQVGGSLSLVQNVLATWVSAQDENLHETKIKDVWKHSYDEDGAPIVNDPPHYSMALYEYDFENGKLVEKDNGDIDPDDPFGQIKDTYPYDTFARLKNVYHANMKNPSSRNDVKFLIYNYGGVGVAYESLNNDTSAGKTYYKETYNCYYNDNAGHGSNHAVMVVGWDDEFPAGNFGITPTDGADNPLDGAWLIRNSWGEQGYAEGGYFWISYYDKTFEDVAYCFEYVHADDSYDNNYQYDGGMEPGVFTYNNEVKAANVFTAKANGEKDEAISGFSFWTEEANQAFKVSIYRGLELIDGSETEYNPESGVLEFESEPRVVGHYNDDETRIAGYEGYYTFDLKKDFEKDPITVAAGEKYSIVITYLSEQNKVVVEMDENASWYGSKVAVKPGESYLFDGVSWTDVGADKANNPETSSFANVGNLRIKAFTNNLDTITERPDQPSEDEVPTEGDAEMADPTKTFVFYGLKAEYPFTGSAIVPAFDLYYQGPNGRVLLCKGIDYNFTVRKNVKANSEAIITITGMGNYAGSLNTIRKFKVGPDNSVADPKKISIKKNYKVTGIDTAGYPYLGVEYEPQIKVVAKPTADVKKAELEKNVDYKISYTNNKFAGNGVMYIYGIGDYSGSILKTFKIKKINMTKEAASFNVSVSANTVFDNAKGVKPSISVNCILSDGYDYPLVEGKDYIVKCTKNKKITDEACFTITGRGNFSGKLDSRVGGFKGDRYFDIVPASISSNNFVICVPDINAGAKVLSTKCEVYDLYGNKIKTKNISDAADIANTATSVGIIFKYDGAVLDPKSKEDKAIVAEAGKNLTIEIVGQNNYKDSQIFNVNISKLSALESAIGRATLKPGRVYYYTGEPVFIDAKYLNVSLRNGDDISTDEYEIMHSNNVNKGTAIAIVRGTNGVTGYKVVKYKIRAKKFVK